MFRIIKQLHFKKEKTYICGWMLCGKYSYLVSKSPCMSYIILLKHFIRYSLTKKN